MQSKNGITIHTQELQRQKADYENKKKAAEQIRIQQEEEEEREQRRRAAQRIQDEQRAMLERQREETRLLEEKRAQEEARQREVNGLRFHMLARKFCGKRSNNWLPEPRELTNLVLKESGFHDYSI